MKPALGRGLHSLLKGVRVNGPVEPSSPPPVASGEQPQLNLEGITPGLGRLLQGNGEAATPGPLFETATVEAPAAARRLAPESKTRARISPPMPGHVALALAVADVLLVGIGARLVLDTPVPTTADWVWCGAACLGASWLGCLAWVGWFRPPTPNPES